MEIFDIVGFQGMLFCLQILNRLSQGTPVTVCDEQYLLIDCLPGRVIVIESAVYGRTTRDACAASDSTYCHASVLAQIQTNCFRRRQCRVVVKPTMISPEPCQGTPKYLNITYECISEHHIHTIGKLEEISDSSGLPGYLVSPNYPMPYNYSLLLKSQFGNSNISIRLLDLEVEARVTTGCYDWLILSDSERVQHTYDYCGDAETVKQPLELYISNLHASFRTDGANSFRGFLIKFKVVDGSGYDIFHEVKTGSVFNTGVLNSKYTIALAILLSLYGSLWCYKSKSRCFSIKTWLKARTRRIKPL